MDIRRVTSKRWEYWYACRVPQFLERQKSFFSQLLDVQEVNDVRQTEMHTAELLVSEHSSSEVELLS